MHKGYGVMTFDGKLRRAAPRVEALAEHWAECGLMSAAER